MSAQALHAECAAGVEEGLLRAYLDGELEREELDRVQQHAGRCDACAERLSRLRLAGALVHGRLALLEADAERVTLAAPSTAMIVALAREGAERQRGWRGPLAAAGAWWQGTLGPVLRPVPVAAGAAAVLLVGAALTQPAVQSFAQGVIQQLRVQRVQPVTLDLAVLRGRPLPGVDDLLAVGKYSGPAQPAVRKTTVADAARSTGLALRGPSRLPAQVKGGPEVWLSEPINFTFTYDGQKLTQAAQEYGVRDAATLAQLRTLDGKTVRGSIPAAAALFYGEPLAGAAGPGATPSARAAATAVRTGPARGAPSLLLIQLKSPSMELPRDVNADQLHDLLLRSGALPPQLATQLAAITDWKSTLVVPVTRGQAREVQVDGASGTLVTGEGPGPVLLWQKDGVLYVMVTSGSEQELLDAARSLAPAR